MPIDDTTALVTGGAAGIGLAITRALVDAGAHVVIVGRDQARMHRVRADLGDRNVTTLTTTRPTAAVVNVGTGAGVCAGRQHPGLQRGQSRRARVHPIAALADPPHPTACPRTPSPRGGHQHDSPLRRDHDRRSQRREALLHGLRKHTTEVRPGQTAALCAASRIAPELVFRAVNKQADTTPPDPSRES